ncbi:hypothetical protein LX36DRAFT_662227 [Colletotrichum falcatum]|nr:hypothetical protein LX36DRAFT_662227 [Colletotrichum falcatum]
MTNKLSRKIRLAPRAGCSKCAALYIVLGLAQPIAPKYALEPSWAAYACGNLAHLQERVPNVWNNEESQMGGQRERGGVMVGVLRPV